MKEICAGKLIKQLAQISVELMGTDMSLYEKKKAEQSTETSVTKYNPSLTEREIYSVIPLPGLYFFFENKPLVKSLLKAAYEIADPEICAMADEKIKQMFELSMQANMKEICAGKLIKQLAQISVELMGTDMNISLFTTK